MDQLEAIRAFVDVVECGSFSRAAKRRGVGQPTVSKAVSALEDRLGAQLLRRTTRSLGLTDAGLAYHTTCVRVLAELGEAEARLSTGRDELVGDLRISCARDYGQGFLWPHVQRFLLEHPRVRVDLVLDDRRLDLVAENIDVAVRIGALEDSSLRARKLGTLSRCTVASPAYLARAGVPRLPAELADHECLRLTTLPDPGRWTYRRASGRLFSVRVSGRLQARSNLVVRDAALAGLGIFLAPEWIVADDLAEGRLVRILREFDAPPVDVHAVFPGSRFVPKRVRSFVDVLREGWGDA